MAKNVLALALKPDLIAELQQYNETHLVVPVACVGDVTKTPVVLTPEYATPVVADLGARMLGGDVVHRLRNNGFRGPIIGLTELKQSDTTEDAEVAETLFLRQGGDRLIRSPYSVRLVDAVIRAVSSRGYAADKSASQAVKLSLANGRLRVNEERHECLVDEKLVSLTPCEMKILILLGRRPGVVRSREELCQEAFSVKFSEKRNIDSHIKRLRRKISTAATQAFDPIVTQYGLGYKFQS